MEGREWHLLDTSFSPGFWEEPKRSSGRSGRAHFGSEGAVSCLSRGEASILREGHQIVGPWEPQLVSELAFLGLSSPRGRPVPATHLGSVIPFPPRFFPSVKWALKEPFLSTFHTEGKQLTITAF